MLRKIALALPLLSMAVVSAQQPAPSDATVLSVSRVILYKTGIGYFEHLATVTGNQSALVPILQTPVTAERISLWNDAMGRRPRRAIWLTNASDLTLDAGSLSIIEAGAFAGEGLLEPLKPKDRRLVSFASDPPSK